MSKYRDDNEPHEVSFEELEILEGLLKTNKLTDRQKKALKSLIDEHYSHD